VYGTHTPTVHTYILRNMYARAVYKIRYTHQTVSKVAPRLPYRITYLSTKHASEQSNVIRILDFGHLPPLCSITVCLASVGCA